jgi:CII-binding regulator of phage lambda lysogenization HflD
MKSMFAPGNPWQREVMKLEQKLREANDANAELRARIRYLEEQLLLLAPHQRTGADGATQ